MTFRIFVSKLVDEQAFQDLSLVNLKKLVSVCPYEQLLARRHARSCACGKELGSIEEVSRATLLNSRAKDHTVSRERHIY